MIVETVESKHGTRCHIVKGKSDIGLSHEQSYETYCGHEHFTGPKTEHEGILNIPRVCNNCLKKFREEHNLEVRY